MAEKMEIYLRDGTLVRHKAAGYEGRIEGTTAIKACFTRGGMSLEGTHNIKEAFQYRIVVNGEPMRHIAPAEDLDILEAASEIICVRCQQHFQSKPEASGKAGGRCACGGWICTACLGCQPEPSADSKTKPCIHQRKRLMRKFAAEKK